MDSLPDGWELGQDFAECENRYSGGGHATETAESADDNGRQRAVNELVAVIRQASRELALIMAEIEAERTGVR